MKILKAIPLKNLTVYTNGFYKNNHFLFQQTCNKLIDQYDCKFDKINQFVLSNLYLTISPIKNKFYASKKNDFCNIYILDCNYNEIDVISLKKVPTCYLGDIISIAINQKDNKILLATKTKVYSITLNGYFIRDELTQSAYQTISKTDYDTILTKKLDGSCCLQKFHVLDTNITAIAYIHCKIIIAYSIDNQAFIATISKSRNLCNPCFIENNITINAIMSNCIKTYLLVTKCKCYNYIYMIDYNKKYNQRDCYCYRKHNSKNDIIESIALIEASLAHILNAEGEKIQKAVKKHKNLCELLSINNSVTDTINKVTLLEQVLLNKLEIASSQCDEKKECNEK